jgi:RimJ/RimL family protein N-acetyltransferase
MPRPALGPTPRLHSERLDLDPLRPVDAAEMVGVLRDPALYAFTGGEPPTADALRDRYQRLVAGSGDDDVAWHNWIVRRRADGSAVGAVQATAHAAAGSAEIAWVIGVPWQGRGYAGEAALALVGWLRGTGVGTIEAHVHPDHAASAAVARRAGLVPTSELADGEVVWRLA